MLARPLPVHKRLAKKGLVELNSQATKLCVLSVSVSDLTKQYGKQKAISSLSFEITKGQVVGFLGPNGAGKSTTMKILSCYIEPSAGDATVCGTSIYKDPVQVRRHIGYLPEHNPLYLEMYIKEYLLFTARMHKLGSKAGKRVNEVIDMTGLGREQTKKIGQLSKGYRQRVGLANALLHDPDVLILDEPTSGLDPNQIVEIRDLIKTVGKEKTVILSTHIMQEVTAMCDRVMILNRGHIVADRPLNQMLELSKGRQTITLEFKRPMGLDVLEQLEGVHQAKKTTEGIIVSAENDPLLREKIFEVAVAQNNPILRMEPVSENLEDVFRQLTYKSI